jgi:hypothetical protein
VLRSHFWSYRYCKKDVAETELGSSARKQLSPLQEAEARRQIARGRNRQAGFIATRNRIEVSENAKRFQRNF